MPDYVNSFKTPVFCRRDDRDRAGRVIGTIGIKPSTVLWKPSGSSKYYSIPLDTFVAWITSKATRPRGPAADGHMRPDAKPRAARAPPARRGEHVRACSHRFPGRACPCESSAEVNSNGSPKLERSASQYTIRTAALESVTVWNCAARRTSVPPRYSLHLTRHSSRPASDSRTGGASVRHAEDRSERGQAAHRHLAPPSGNISSRTAPTLACDARPSLPVAQTVERMVDRV